jgi:hypothetical protein
MKHTGDFGKAFSFAGKPLFFPCVMAVDVAFDYNWVYAMFLEGDIAKKKNFKYCSGNYSFEYSSMSPG